MFIVAFHNSVARVHQGNWWTSWSVIPKGKSYYKGVGREPFLIGAAIAPYILQKEE